MRIKRHRKRILLSAAVLAGLSGGVRFAGATSIPLVNVSILASNNSGGPYTSSLIIAPGQTTVYFEVAEQMAPVGSANGNGQTITSLTQGGLNAAGFDGLNTVAFDLTDAVANPIQVNFTAAALNAAGLNIGGVNGDSWAAGTGHAAGAPTIVGGGSNHNALIGSIAAQNSGVDAGAIAPSVMETGTFGVAANASALSSSTIGGAYGSANGGFQINSDPVTGVAAASNRVTITTATEAGSSPYVGFTPLTLYTGLAWDGGAGNGKWDINTTANFSGSKYNDGVAVQFGDTSASGGAVANTNPITITSGGVQPAFVQFTGGSTSYTLTSAGTTGIGGAASVAQTGGANVTFSSANTYSGGTTIGAGILFANNSSNSATGSGNVTVGAGKGQLRGSGTVSGNVFLAGSTAARFGGVIGAGATFSTIGILTTGNQTWSGGAVYDWKIGSSAGTLSNGIHGTPGQSYDELIIGSSGTPLTVTTTDLAAFSLAPRGALTNVTHTTYNWAVAQIGVGTSTTIDLDGSIISPSASTNLLASQNAGGGNEFALDTAAFSVNGGFSIAPAEFSLFFETLNGNNDLVLQYTATPEPATLLLTTLGMAGMVLPRRRMLKRKA